MNDLTKEELQDLECWLRVTSKQDITLPSDKDKEYILDKLQSMIDTYCEHSNKQYYEHVMLYECNDCHMVTL